MNFAEISQNTIAPSTAVDAGEIEFLRLLLQVAPCDRAEVLREMATAAAQSRRLTIATTHPESDRKIETAPINLMRARKTSNGLPGVDASRYA
jgi:hypothetical protein